MAFRPFRKNGFFIVICVLILGVVIYFNHALFAPFSHKRGLGAGEGFKEGKGGGRVPPPARANPPPPPPPPPPTTTKAPVCVDPGPDKIGSYGNKCCINRSDKGLGLYDVDASSAWPTVNYGLVQCMRGGVYRKYGQ